MTRMPTEQSREMPFPERPVGPEGRPEPLSEGRETPRESSGREYRALIDDIAEAERQAAAVMGSATEGLDDVPFELTQLKRDSEEFLRENAERMRAIAEEARREAEAIAEEAPETEGSRAYLDFLDRHFFPATAGALDKMPEKLRDDPDAFMAVIDDKFEAAARAHPDDWPEIEAKLDFASLDAAALPLAERYAGLLEEAGPAVRRRFFETYLGKRTAAAQRRKMAPAEVLATGGGSSFDVRMALEAMRRTPPADDDREPLLLRAVVKGGTPVLKEFPELFEGVADVKIADALVESNPSASAKALADLPLERQIRNLRILAEAHPPSALEGLKRLPDLGPDAQIDALVTMVAGLPELGGRLDELGLSASEKLAVGLRLARKHPDAFPDYVAATGSDLSLEEKIAVTQDLLEKNPALLPSAAEAMRFSHDTVVDILRRYPMEQRLSLMDALGVPSSDAEAMLDEARAHSLPERRETREEKEAAMLIEKTDRASVDLMLAMERTILGAAEAERSRVGDEQRLHGRIQRVGAVSGESANSPRYVLIEGRDMPALYKSRLRERGVRDGIPEGGMVGREVLASFIDRALRFGLVPATVLRNGPEGIAAVQDWKVGDVATTVGWAEDRHREELKKLGLFDWLTQNSDRHAGNWLISKDGKHVAIDNGAIFGERVHDYDKLRSFPLTEVNGEPVPEGLRKNVEDLLENREVLAILKEMFMTLLGPKDGKRSWREFEGRLHRAADPDFRLPDSEWTIFHAGIGKG